MMSTKDSQEEGGLAYHTSIVKLKKDELKKVQNQIDAMYDKWLKYVEDQMRVFSNSIYDAIELIRWNLMPHLKDKVGELKGEIAIHEREIKVLKDALKQNALVPKPGM